MMEHRRDGQSPGGRPSGPGNRSGGGQRGGQRGGGREEKKLPQARAQTYYTADDTIDPVLLDEGAEKVAQEFVRDDLKPTQLRRFYEDVMRIRQRLDTNARGNKQLRASAFEALRAEFKMLKAKAAYANGRDERTFPRSLLQFFIDHTSSVNDARDFDAFCRHFQAVVAFHRFYRPKD